MQVVLLAAGKSSRFYPFNDTHKALFEIAGKPIIVHTIEEVKKAGFTDIFVSAPKKSEVRSLLGDGKRFGVSIQFIDQEEPTGAGEALRMIESKISGDFFLLNPNRVEFGDMFEQLLLKKKKGADVALLARKVHAISDFGALEVKGDKVLDIVEKPENGNEQSNLKVVGMYLLSKPFLKTLGSVAFEHYSLEKALSLHAKEHTVLFVETDKNTSSLKYPWDLFLLKDLILEKQTPYISNKAVVAKSAHITGNVVVEDGAKILENAVVKGPCYIGRNVTVGNSSLIREYTSLEEGVVVGAFMEVKNSLLSKGTTTHSGFIGDSIIGRDCKTAAFFCTANVRLDRESVKVKTSAFEVNSGKQALGVIMGNNVRCGIRVSTMPGVIIGKNSVIGPHSVVLNSVGEDVVFYTKYQEIVEKKQ